MECHLQNNVILALHGFLGQRQDWFACEKHLKAHWITPALFTADAPAIENFSSYIDKMIAAYLPPPGLGKKKIFLGYSLGGRLGLYLLEKYADQFDHFVFVSTNPGLQDSAELSKRLASDRQWASIIHTEPWDNFLQQWNLQPVFTQHALEPGRYEKDFDLKKLAIALDIWSLGQQHDFRPLIQKYQQKITWVVGEKDSKFLSIAQDMKQKKILQDFCRINSGHRIVFENPKELCDLLHKLF